jgi:hypothetical protein
MKWGISVEIKDARLSQSVARVQMAGDLDDVRLEELDDWNMRGSFLY